MVYLYNNGLDSKDVFTCPANYDTPQPPCQYNDAPSQEHKILEKGSYIINTVYDWNTQARNLYNQENNTSFTATYMDNNFRGWTGDSNATTPIKISSVNNFSSKIYILDGFKKPDIMLENTWKNDMKSLGNWEETDYGIPPDNLGSNRRDVGYHHLRNGFNILFGDLHAASQSSKTRASDWVATE